MSGSDDVAVSTPRPRDVPGFSDAWQLGLLARVPTDPPRLLPGEPAGRLCNLWVTKVVASAVVTVLFVQLVQDLPGWLTSVLMLGSGLLWFWLSWFRWPAAHSARKLLELRHGYTTLTWTLGMVTPTVDRRWRGTAGVPWDYRGVWVLGHDGRIVTPPDHDVEPPGFYPSPNRPRELELWTGCAWSGHYAPWPGRA